jgi:ABC-2 type transport system permease protein
MKRIWLLVKKDFLKKWKNPFTILGFTMIPLLFTLIFGLVFGASGETKLPKIRVLVVDRDQSLVSRLVLSAMTQGEMAEMMDLIPMEDEEEARKRLEGGRASALLVFPPDFGSDAFDGKATELLLIKNPSEQFLPQIVEEITDTAGLLLSSLLSVFRDEVDSIRAFSGEDKITDQAVSDISISVRRRIDGMAKYVFPPAVTLKRDTIKEEDEEEDASISVHGYILPAIAIMFLLFVVNIVFEDILRERESGTLLRQMASPMHLREFIWSKMVTAALLGTLCTWLLIGLGALFFNIGWGPPLTVFLIVLALNILISGFISVFYAFIKTENQAGSIISSVIIVMSLLGGSMIPVEQFPGPIQILSRATINYWGIQAFLRSMEGSGLAEILPVMAGMAAVGLILSLVSSRLLAKNLRKGLAK